jgi:hypothetical protein
MTTPHFQTTALNLAAYLITLGHPLTRVDGMPGQRRTFQRVRYAHTLTPL